jgi:hypothetical protein
MARLLEDIEHRFDEAQARAHQRKMEELEKQRVKQAEAAARAAQKANDNSILW